MKKKALFTTVAAVALVAVVGIGSTLAYFTDNATKDNVVTFGHVEITLDEPEFNKNPQNEDKIHYIANVVPGQEITKDPTITVAKGSEDAYLRASIIIFDEKESFLRAEEGQKTKVEELIEKIAFKEDWVLGTDGYYYYQKPVKAGTKVVFFDKVTIPNTWGNEVADLSFNINVQAEAIQAANFTPVKKDNKIVAWTVDGTADGTPITTETYPLVAEQQTTDDNQQSQEDVEAPVSPQE